MNEKEKLNIELYQNSIIGIIGIDGSGKTTLLKKIEEDMKLGVDNYKFDSNIIRVSKLKETLEKKEEFDKDYFNQLILNYKIDESKEITKMSIGMKKKLELISKLSLKPKLLLLDDFTKGIDPIVKEQMFEMILAYKKDFLCTIVFSTIVPGDIVKLKGRVVLLKDKKILLNNTLEELNNYFGIIHTDKEKFPLLEKEEVYSYIKNYSKIEVLIKNKNYFNNLNFTVEDAILDDIIRLVLNGESYKKSFF